MSKQLNILQQIEAFDSGQYDAGDFNTQVSAGWYDWFCAEKSLRRKTQNLYKKVKALVKTKRIQELDLENCYVWFKNNCPMDGKLYDDIRIADIFTRDVLFTIVPKCGHRSTPKEEWASIHGDRTTPETEFRHNAFRGMYWKDIIEYLNK